MNMKWMLLGMVCAVSAFGQGATNLQVRTLADKVNLRARPESGTEVVAQAGDGQSLVAVRVEGEWLGVLAPTNAGVWVKSQFVKDGIVMGDKIKLRSGPGISYRDVGLLRKGVSVSVRMTQGEWLKVDPPEDLVLWVNKSLVQAVPVTIAGTAQGDAAVLQASVEAGGEVSTNSLLTRELPPGLPRDQLAAVLGQGALVERTGTVERVPLAFFRGVDYRLVDVRDGTRVTVCFLEGNDSQMPSLVGRRLVVKGREYWLRNQRFAVVYPEVVKPVAE
jgi:SH3-like domain-containing protein